MAIRHIPIAKGFTRSGNIEMKCRINEQEFKAYSKSAITARDRLKKKVRQAGYAVFISGFSFALREVRDEQTA